MGHQDSGLDREKEKKTTNPSVALWGLTVLSKPNTTTFLGQEANYCVKVKCPVK